MIWKICALTLITVFSFSVNAASDESGPLDSILTRFDTLHQDTLKHHISKRDIYSQHPTERRVEYDSLGRHFKLNLRTDNSLLAPNFRVVAVDGQNNERVVDIKPNIYRGYLEDEPDSSIVNAYWDDDNTLTASIRTKDDVYVVEPSWRHLPDSSNYSMISYRRSDMMTEKDLGSHFCGYVEEKMLNGSGTVSGTEKQLDDREEDREKEQGEERVRRNVETCSKDGKTACSLYLVADFKFYEAIGFKDIAKTTRYIIGMMDYIDSIYRGHEFGKCQSMGFTIQELKVYEAKSIEPVPKELRFNTDKSDWDTTELLQAFSENAKFKEFCLAHLFTHIAFKNGVLGLAYIGSSRPYSVGGICSPSYHKDGKELFLNSGWSSSLNRYDRSLLTEELRLVTAHELGHNWGSEHDPDSSECSPSASAGGKYIMYTYSVSGMDSNNKMFSPCSRRAIGLVLQSKANTCFTKPTQGYCGNSRVEPDAGEECDAGPVEVANLDPCCDTNCKLRPPAVCSDKNSICCDNCQFSKSDKPCYSAQELLCEDEQKCNGYSADCPKPPHKADGVACLTNETSKCKNGVCVSICEYNNLNSCVSDEVEKSCKWSCKDKTVNSSCEPFRDPQTNLYITVPDGMPCVQGYCEGGKCVKQVHDRIQRLWHIIENISGDELVKFMRANIVGTVIVLSLVVWIPASCVVAYIDRKRAARERDDLDWYSPDNSKLFVMNDNIRVVRPESVKYRPTQR